MKIIRHHDSALRVRMAARRVSRCVPCRAATRRRAGNLADVPRSALVVIQHPARLVVTPVLYGFATFAGRASFSGSNDAAGLNALAGS